MTLRLHPVSELTREQLNVPPPSYWKVFADEYDWDGEGHFVRRPDAPDNSPLAKWRRERDLLEFARKPWWWRFCKSFTDGVRRTFTSIYKR